MDKTITVLVDRRVMHPLYKKFIRRSKKYAAHDEVNACKTGDMVRIVECPPVSKRKAWTVIERNGAILESASADALASVQARAHSHISQADVAHAEQHAREEAARDAVPPAENLPVAEAPSNADAQI
jgi:small subunit ribosomal protein S17